MLSWFKGSKSRKDMEEEKEAPGQAKCGQEESVALGPPPAPERRTRIKTDLMVHDLKVPLAVIEAGISSLLGKREKYGPLSQAQEKVLKRVLRNVKVTQTLVSDIMELGRASMGIISREGTRISYLVSRAVGEIMDLVEAEASEEILECHELSRLKQVLKGKGILLSVEDDVWQKEIEADVAKVVQILRNLLSNAMKYKKHLVELFVTLNENTLKLGVRDDGEGIPEEYHQRIFECYFQVDQSEISCVRGHGLGLAGVMVLLEDMGGRLTLDSRAGEGATFVVELPLN